MDNKKINWKKIIFWAIIGLFIVFKILVLIFLKNEILGENRSFIFTVVLFIIFIFISLFLVAKWLYLDCKNYNQDPFLWLIVFFLVGSPIVLIVYFFVRGSRKKSCQNCNYMISINSNYCENCGFYIKNENEQNLVKETFHNKFLIAGILTFIGGLISFIIVANIIIFQNENKFFEDENVKTYNITEAKEYINKGFQGFNKEYYNNNEWEGTLNWATKGFVKDEKMQILNPEEEILYADISCNKKSEDRNIILYLIQENKVKSIDVTNLKEPLKYPLEDFKKGKIYVRFQINGVNDIKWDIKIE